MTHVHVHCVCVCVPQDADSIPNSSSRFSLARSSRAVGALNPTSPVQGLQLGALLGTGSFGSVYAGHWYGTPVAIKVIDQDIKQLQAAGAQMEAILGTSHASHTHMNEMTPFALAKVASICGHRMGAHTALFLLPN